MLLFTIAFKTENVFYIFLNNREVAIFENIKKKDLDVLKGGLSARNFVFGRRYEFLIWFWSIWQGLITDYKDSLYNFVTLKRLIGTTKGLLKIRLQNSRKSVTKGFTRVEVDFFLVNFHYSIFSWNFQHLIPQFHNFLISHLNPQIRQHFTQNSFSNIFFCGVIC